MNLIVGDKVIKASNVNDYCAKELSVKTEYEVERIELYYGTYFVHLKYYLYPVNSKYLIKVNV